MNNDYYELVPVQSNDKIFRIRATQDLPRHGVLKGEYGGVVASKNNLHGGAWLSTLVVCTEDAQVFDGAYVGGEIHLRGSAQVFGNVSIIGVDNITHNTIIHGD